MELTLSKTQSLYIIVLWNIKQMPESTRIIEIPVMSFDLGNRKNAATVGKGVIHYPSYAGIKKARQTVDVNSPSFVRNKSFLVEFGSCSYIVGQESAELLEHNPTYTGDKWKKVKEFLFASIHALNIGKTLHIKELRCSVPDDLDEAQCGPFRSMANKTHPFIVNGTEYKVRIDKVVVVAEGVFAWYRAIKENLLQYSGYVNGVLDLGGGTAIGRLINPNGTILRGREVVLDRGTYELANSIAGELRDSKLKESMIMDSIADGTFLVKGVNFKSVYDYILPTWVEGIRSDLNTAWKPLAGSYAQILVVGGSAPLFAPFVSDNPKYVIAPNPQFYGLEGMHNG